MATLKQLIEQKININRLLNERNVINTGDIQAFVRDAAESVNIPNGSPEFNTAVKTWITGNLRKWILDLYPNAQRLTAEQLPANPAEWMVQGVNSADGLYSVDVNDQNLKQFVADIIEFFSINTQMAVNSISRITVPDMQKNIDKAKKEKEGAAKEAQVKKRELILEPGTEVVIDYGDGWSWRKILTKEALIKEGDLMNHCVGRNYQSNLANGEWFFSLRDPYNTPTTTLYVQNPDRNGGSINMIKCKSNSHDRQYGPKVLDLIVKLRLKGATSNNDFKKFVGDEQYIPSGDGTIFVPELLQGDYNSNLIINLQPTDEDDKTAKYTTKKNILTLGKPNAPLRVNGEVMLHDSEGDKRLIKIAANPVVVVGDFNIVDVVVSMPEAVAIGGDADWTRASIIKSPSQIRVEGDFHFPRLIKGLPTKIVVKGTLFIPKAMEEKVKAIVDPDQKISVF